MVRSSPTYRRPHSIAPTWVTEEPEWCCRLFEHFKKENRFWLKVLESPCPGGRVRSRRLLPPRGHALGHFSRHFPRHFPRHALSATMPWLLMATYIIVHEIMATPSTDSRPIDQTHNPCVPGIIQIATQTVWYMM